MPAFKESIMNHNPKKFLALLAAVFCLCSFSAFSKEKDPFKISKNPFLLEFEYELDDDAKAFLENSGIKYKKKKIQMDGTQAEAVKVLCEYYEKKIEANLENIENFNNPNYNGTGRNYYEKTVRLSKIGEISLTEESEKCRLSYEPESPYAMTDRINKGFVKYPAIDEVENAKELTKNLSIMRDLRAWKITTEYFYSFEDSNAEKSESAKQE